MKSPTHLSIHSTSLQTHAKKRSEKTSDNLVSLIILFVVVCLFVVVLFVVVCF